MGDLSVFKIILEIELHSSISFHCFSVVPISMNIVGFLSAVGPWWVASIVIWKSENSSWLVERFFRYDFWIFGCGIAICFGFPPNFAISKFPVLWHVKAKVPDSAACFERKINPSYWNLSSNQSALIVGVDSITKSKFSPWNTPFSFSRFWDMNLAIL